MYGTRSSTHGTWDDIWKRREGDVFDEWSSSEDEDAWRVEPCPGLVDYVMIWIKESFIKNEKSTIDIYVDIFIYIVNFG